MSYLSVNVRQNKEFGRILRSAFPGYRKHTVSVRFQDSATIHPSHWDGGSKDEFFLMSSAGQSRNISIPSSWPNPPQSENRDVPENGAIVSGGTFRGKASHFIVYIREADKAVFGLADYSEADYD